jgi:hypothetical protein
LPIVGLPARTYYDRRARHHDGQQTVRGPWPTPAHDRVAEAVVAMALAFPDVWASQDRVAVQARRRRHVRRDLPARST